MEFDTVISNPFRPKNTPTLARPSEECIKSHGETLTVKNLHNGSEIPKANHFNHSSLRAAEAAAALSPFTGGTHQASAEDSQNSLL
ncbi:hypothetical protein L3X38_016817 [Prunus dulcis]|uniref:Uncharacterized protein n=1 Tax=Prunus dulcis TaxID=3755 RepID=A0AAD4W8J5_PRUDU|nr:hypothetical protein L3X38_016817 [Prunus dulcis]